MRINQPSIRLHAAERMLTKGRLETLLAGFAAKRIMVISDLVLDEWDDVKRISPEAPVPVV